MKKLGKKLNVSKETLQAYMCPCSCAYYCWAGVPDYAPQISLTSSTKA